MNMVRRYLASAGLCAALALISACDDLPTREDPRDPQDLGTDADPTDGRCSGTPVECLYRSEDQCEGGACELVEACRGEAWARCVSHGSALDCEADNACRWSDPPGVCGIDSQLACHALGEDREDCDQLDECEWGTTCEGGRVFCWNIDARDACEENHGCEWIPD